MLVSNVDKHTKEDEIPVRLCNYVDVYKNDRITDRLAFMRATASKNEIERFRLQIGDVIITKDSEEWDDIGVPALVEHSAPDLVCGYHLAILRPCDGITIGGYLLRALQSQGVASQFYVSANGVTRYGLSKDAIKSVVLPIPPLHEQAAIVRYFDIQDRRINNLIRTKRRLIELLNEQKQAIIHKAVTCGIDPNVRLKPSGIEWLDDVPEAWIIKPLKRWAGINLKTLPDNTSLDYEFRYLDISSVSTGHLTQQPKNMKFGIAPSRARRVLKKGDTIISTVRTYLKAMYYVAEDATNLVASTGFAVLTPLREINPEYLSFVIQNNSFIDRVTANSIGVAYPAITEIALGTFQIALPPSLDEQQAILQWIKLETASFDQAIRRTQREIDLLREYRTRLIFDVVTGKLDVRGVELPAMDEAEVQEDIEIDEDTEAEDLIESEEVANADE
jgi:type I restriction enzyme S subunit